jgi:hypothetical protein
MRPCRHRINTHTINVNKTCALQQTTDKTGTKKRLCEIVVNITNCVIFFTHDEHVGHHYAHTNTINVNKTCALHQTTGKTRTKHSLCEIDVNME